MRHELAIESRTTIGETLLARPARERLGRTRTGMISRGRDSIGSMMTDEAEALLSALNAQREHILGALEGLSDEDLRRPVLPTGWTCLGLVRHLALDVERFWFRAAVAGEHVGLMSGAAAWNVPAETPAASVLDLYRDEIARANAIITATAPDAMPKWWPVEIFPDFPARPLRKTVLHVITETATHAGHLDAVRELIDGRTWVILTGT